MSAENLISIEEALNISAEKANKLFKKYQNPGLAKLLGLLGLDMDYIKAEGTTLTAVDGSKYIDFLAGYGSLNLGHNPASVIEAVEKVSSRPNILQTRLNTLSAVLSHNLAQVLPGELSNSFFCNSGTEAVEGAVKLARAATGKKKIIYCNNSFHGKTMGSLSVTGRKKYQEEFVPLVPGCKSIPFGNLKALEDTLNGAEDTAAFIVEPIQGEGGINLAPTEYLSAVKNICRKNNVLLILDEVQTGLGRTGKMFACEHEGISPDVICLAKSLGGGIMPIGAFVTTAELWDRAYGSTDKCLLHTSTFGGNTRAVMAAIAVIQEIVEKDLSRQAKEKGYYLINRLKKEVEGFSLIKEVRGKGLLIGIEFNGPKDAINEFTHGLAGKLSKEYLGSIIAGELFKKYQIITAYSLNNPNVIRLEPPLIVTYEELDYVVDAFKSVLKENSSLQRVFFSGAKNIISSFIKK